MWKFSVVGSTVFLPKATMKTRRPQHVCKFMKTCKTLDAFYPPDKKFSKVKRKFRECLLISEENGRKCYTPQGTAGYIFQKEKQLTQSFSMIHPYSKFCNYWEILAIIEFLIAFTIRAFLVSHLPGSSATCKYQIPALIADLFETADVWLRLNIGYMDKEIQDVVLERRKVFLHTIKTFFFYTDAITSFPIEFLSYLYSLENGLPHPVIKYCVLFKIIKVYSLSRYLVHISKIYGWSDLWLNIVSCLFCNFLLCHCLACGYYLSVPHKFFEMTATPIQSDDYFYRYISMLHIMVGILFEHRAFSTSYLFDNSAEKIAYCFVLVVLNTSYVIFLGNFLQLLAFLRTSKMLYGELVQEVRKFLIMENLPKYIHVKVMKYLDFRYTQRYFNEEIILKTLSPPLRGEVLKFLCLDLIKKRSSIFQNLPKKIAIDLCLYMKFEIFLPGDIIFKVGKVSNRIYFLYSGSVAVYSPQGKEIMHWYEGQQFGTSAFMDNPVHPVTAIALEMSECYHVLYSDFFNLVGDSPHLIAVVSALARERVEYAKKLF